jgi:pyruvate dehydrogenase E1 component alpha subunit
MERKILHQQHRDMLLTRTFEERAAAEYTKANIRGFLQLYPGEEAVAAGVINAADPSDYVVSIYREHVHALHADGKGDLHVVETLRLPVA